MTRKSAPRSREQVRVALLTTTRNRCFPTFEKGVHNESVITVGRRNWLFSGSFAAAQRSALILSIVETCKANSIDAEAYMADVMERIQDDWPASRWDELMPWNWSPLSDTALPIAA